MSPELITAIKERLAAGQTRAEIETAVLAMGHAKEVFDAAYTLAVHDRTEQKNSELPKVTTLFMNGWNFVKTRPDVLALLCIPLTLEVLVSFFWGVPAGDPLAEPSAPLFLSFMLLGALYVVTIATALFVVTESDHSTPTLRAAAVWVRSHVFSLFFVYLLSGLVVLGGFLLFLIPGIIAAIAITFAQYAFITDGKRGMEALLASRQVVRGRWFLVARKMFGFILLSLIPMLLFGMLYGVISTMVGDGVYSTLIGELLIQVLSAVVSLMSLHAMFQLYQALKVRASAEVSPTRAHIRYWILSGVTLVFIVGMIALAIFDRDSITQLEEAVAPLESSVSVTVPNSFSQFREKALQHANTQQGSYAGVCEVLRPIAAVDGDVTCNDSDTAWAVEVIDIFGDRFCADDATPGKALAVPLGTKTECISI